MKKFLLVLITALVIAPAAVHADSESISRGEIKDKVLLYFPNRIMDLLDIFSLNIGIGPVAEARLMATRYCDVGAGIGMTAKIYKDFNRQYALGVEENWYWSFIFVGEEQYRVLDGSVLLDKYVECRAGIPVPESRTYDFYTGPRDFWAIGGSLGLLLDGDLYIHPVEIADFLLGIFFVDIRKDDLTFDTFAE